MKRLLAFTISALLLCPMTSFAAQTEEAKAVYQEMMEKSQTLNEMNAYYDMTVQMTGDMFQELGINSMDMRIEMNTRIQNMTDLPHLRYHAYTRISMPEMMETEPIEGSMYYMDGYYYMDMLGQKIKTPMPLDQAMEEIASASQMFDNTSLEEFTDLTLRTEGENRILSYTMNAGKLNDQMKAILGASGMGSLYQGVTFNVSNIRGEYIVNPDGYYIKANILMDMSMTMEGEALNMSIVADVGVADPGQPVAVNWPNPAEYVEQPIS